MNPSAMAAQIKLAEPGAVKLSVDLERELWEYQVNDVAWMLAQTSGLVGHGVGTGKTVFGISVATYLRQHGRLKGMLVMVPKQGGLMVRQWLSEFSKWSPDLRVVSASDLSPAERRRLYSDGSWDVMVINYEAARMDVELLEKLSRSLNVLYADEASVFRNPGSSLYKMMRRLSPHFEYRFALTGTPIETRVEDLWGIMSGMGWESVVGTRADFMRNFTIREWEDFYAKGGRKMRRQVVVGYQNLGVLRERIEPWFIRRTAMDPEVREHLPEVQAFTLRPKMTPAQARGYKALKKGIVAKLKNGQAEITQSKVQEPWIRMLAAADGLRTLDPDMKDESGKSDWLMEALQEQFAGEKVIVFSRFYRSLVPLGERLEAAGIGYARYVGSDWQSQKERLADVDRFQTDPSCRVLLATSAVERGLNLQVARVVVLYGIVANPARLEQIVGRIRRGSSEFSSVYAVTLITEGTVEEGLYDSALERANLADWFWEEESMLFEKLGPEKLAELIRS